MRVVVYGKPRQRECLAVAQGCEALGYRVVWRNHGWFDPTGDVFDDAALVVTFGQRLWSGVIADTYRRRGVPVLTVDLPPIRLEGYRALWLERVNWVPDGPMDSRRLARLQLPFTPLRSAGNKVLVCGQVAGDAAHQMSAKQTRKWAEAVLAEIDRLGFDAVWRPHPEDRVSIGGVARSDPDTPLHTVLDGDWWALVTHNSTSGITAILKGIPVFCAPDCFYRPLGNDCLQRMDVPFWPTLGERWDFFSRLAYAQWTFEELESGEAIQFALGQHEKRRQPVAAA